VAPDLMIFAKGVTSGYLPLSGVMLTGEVHRTLLNVRGFLPHGFTYSGHPTACAVALRNLQIIEDEHLVERVAELGPKLLARLQELRKHEIVGDVRGLGFLAAIELVRDRSTKESFEGGPATARKVWLQALAEGVIVRPLGPGDVIAMSPPFVLSEQQIDRIGEVLDKAIANVQKELAVRS
jgi:putrescine aminotransferase